MATPRKSAQQLAAREKARTKAKELTERHERLIEMAAAFFEQQEHAELLRTEAKKKAEAILAKAEADAQSAVQSAAQTVKAMLGAGEAKSAVAARLGLSGAEVKRMIDLVTERPEPAEPDGVQGPEVTEPGDVEAA
ncbi:hypothetical protein [Arthrobacter sp. efr-133-R2A-63]|uniref:hypothetical protein n=1 Tax=Arthrobacter sp. efr-133-R2A-63 TaxID=3040278 RepID=UPI00254B8B79|nr:hypothetical protein [Arthrobacter sp. efr-133-R2A-63]